MITKEKTETNETKTDIRRKVFIPRMDIVESKEEVVITADVPGADEKSTDITINDDELEISAKVSDETPEGSEPAYAEYEVGDFRRTFTLPEFVDKEGIRAVVKNGVLKLTLPKIKPPEPKKIEVRTE